VPRRFGIKTSLSNPQQRATETIVLQWLFAVSAPTCTVDDFRKSHMNMASPSLFEYREFVGDRDGPQLLITAGIHGDEYLPMLAVKELIDRFDSNAELLGSLSGSLTLIPIANQSAYTRGNRCGADNIDLARVFPGAPNGNPTEQLAC